LEAPFSGQAMRIGGSSWASTAFDPEEPVMAGESIERVRKAEREAEGIIERASEEAEEIESSARRGLKKRIEEAGDRAERDGAEIRERLLEEAESEIEDIREGAQSERTGLRKKAEARKDEAVEAVLQLLEGFGPVEQDGG
jgi:V/A-type H+/Na+-transporting ATPase subunit G/H